MRFCVWLRGTSLASTIHLFSGSVAAQAPAHAESPPSATAPTPTPTPAAPVTSPTGTPAPSSAPGPAETTAAPATSTPATPAPAAPVVTEAAPETVAPAAAGSAPAADVEPTNAPAAIAPGVTLGAGAILYYYQPIEAGDNNFSLFFANLVLDGKWGVFGFHLEPRFRDTRLRPFFEGPAWVQEVYGSLELDPVTIKLGKVYKQSGGLFWDNSFYGNVQVYDGLKLDPNYGVSVEGSIGEEFGVDFAAQFFIVDGSTNVSLQDRDTISIPGARRRNTIAGRVAPFVKFGAGDVRLGLTGEHFKADIPEQNEGVTRLAADVKLGYDLDVAGKFGIWGEFLHQDGRHVVDHPLVGEASGDNDYFLAGVEYSYWRLTARYNLSYANYSDADVTEVLHVPGLGVSLHDKLSLLGEFVVWRQNTPAADLDYDKSVNVTLHGKL